MTEKMSKHYYPITASILILIGAAVIAIWTMLILGRVTFTGAPAETLAMGFHLASELIMATGAVITGIYLLFGREGAKRALYGIFGMIFSSTVNAVIHYLTVEQDPAAAIALTVISIITLTLLVIGTVAIPLPGIRIMTLYKSGLFLFGYLFYLLMNIISGYAEPGSYPIFIQLGTGIVLIPFFCSVLIAGNLPGLHRENGK